jgi:hypothetical protein
MSATSEKKLHRVDWARVQRDYATGKFTDQELADKHNTAREVVNRRRRTDRAKDPTSWPVDLRADVKRATAAMLMRSQLTRTVASGTEAETVLAAAQMTRDVILQHRTEVRQAREVAAALLEELKVATLQPDALRAVLNRAAATMDDAEAQAFAAQARELVKLHNRVSSLQKLTDAMARLQTQERKAFGIADEDTGSSPLDTMSEAELQAEVDRLQALQAGGA